MHQLKTYLAIRQMQNGRPNSTIMPIMYFVKRVPKDLFLDYITTIMNKVFISVQVVMRHYMYQIISTILEAAGLHLIGQLRELFPSEKTINSDIPELN